MDVSKGPLDHQRLWAAAQRMDEGPLGEGLSELGGRALSMFRESGVKNILVLGCGQDSDAMGFAREGVCVTTVDFSSVGLDQTGRTEKAESNDRCGALLAKNIRDRLPEPSTSVDAIYSTLFLCLDLQEEEITEIMWQCLHVLKPGGLKVLSVFSDHHPDCGKATKCGEDEWQGDSGFVAHFFTEDKIRRMARGFELLWIREYQEDKPPATGVMYEVVLMRPKR
jgi:SAM-dependent methyltransferase